jgi:hypothetical protein
MPTVLLKFVGTDTHRTPRLDLSPFSQPEVLALIDSGLLFGSG